MTRQVLFLQGAGEGAYEADAKLAESLRQALGADYEVVYPAMPDEANVPYDEWRQLIEKHLAEMPAPAVVVGHSIGGSVALKSLGEIKLDKPLAGICSMASPFWGGDGWLYEGYETLELPNDVAAHLPQGTPVYLYHCKDDEIVPYEHLALLQQLLPKATLRQQDTGGHQFNDDLTVVAQDIEKLFESK